MKQDQNEPVPVEKQVAILYAVINGVLTDIKTEDVRQYEKKLYSFLDSDADGAAAMQEIRSTGKLEKKQKKKLKNALENFTGDFLETEAAKQ